MTEPPPSRISSPTPCVTIPPRLLLPSILLGAVCPQLPDQNGRGWFRLGSRSYRHILQQLPWFWALLNASQNPGRSDRLIRRAKANWMIFYCQASIIYRLGVHSEKGWPAPQCRSGPFQLLRFVVLSNDFFRALSIEALRSLHGLDIFSKLALCLAGSPNGQVTFKDIVDLFQGTASGFWVGEKDMECHRCAKHAEDDVWLKCQLRADFLVWLDFTYMSSTGCW